MEYMSTDDAATTAQILCCGCGTLIEPNPANMCVACMRSQVDITEEIPKQMIVYFCKGCEKYQQAQGQWVDCELESRELLTLCLKKVKGLNTVNLIDATFVWTEPHSRRIKVKLVVQKEVMGGAVLQQSFVIEYVVNRMMCDSCHRIEAKDFWKAITQVRQRASHKKTFFYLEQLLLKHKANSKCVNIKPAPDGLDFYFDKRDDARKLADFLTTVVPSRYVTSERLISHDVHNNTANFKHTYSVEIAPICKDDIVCLPLSLSRTLGSIGQLCICLRVTNQIYLIEPFTLKTAEVNAALYFKTPFKSIAGSKQLTSYTVMDIEMTSETKARGFGTFSEKHLLADVWVVRTSELGIQEDYTHTRSHLGHLLKPGDTVMGFDLKNANVNDANFEKLEEKHGSNLMDVILVKKWYGEKGLRNRRRKWKLRRLNVDNDASDGTSLNQDYEDFLEDMEEDPVSRRDVNIYKDEEKLKNQMSLDEETDDDGVPCRISLQEMLDDMKLDE